MRKRVKVVADKLSRKNGLVVKNKRNSCYICEMFGGPYSYKYDKIVTDNVAKLIGAVTTDTIYIPEFLEEELAVLWIMYCYNKGLLVVW